MQTFEPFVSMAEKDGAGEVLYAASRRGPTTYTAFVATRDACVKHRDEFAAMTRATAKMLAWLYSNPPEEFANAVTKFFPDLAADILLNRCAAIATPTSCRAEPSLSHRAFRSSRKVSVPADLSAACRAMTMRRTLPQRNSPKEMTEEPTMTDMTITAVRTTTLRVPWPDTPG